MFDSFKKGGEYTICSKSFKLHLMTYKLAVQQLNCEVNGSETGSEPTCVYLVDYKMEGNLTGRLL